MSRMHRVNIGRFMGLAVCLLLATLRPASARVVRITNNATNHFGNGSEFADFNNKGQIVWQEGPEFDPNSQIYLWDGAVVRLLSQGTFYNTLPRLNDAGQVVWQASPSEPGTTEIYRWDGSSVQRFTHYGNSKYDVRPVINNAGQIAWAHGSGLDFHIRLWNGVAVQELPNAGSRILGFHLNNAGQVVWNGFLGSAEIFFWDGTSLQNLSNTPTGDDYSQINDTGHVVWQGYDAGWFWIYLWDGAQVRKLTSISASFGALPQINRSGQIAWSALDDHGVQQIFFWDGASIRQISDAPSANFVLNLPFRPQLNDAGQIVWERWTGQNRQIFLWDGTTIQQLSDSSKDNFGPRINNAGQVIWYSKDRFVAAGGNDPPYTPAEIYLYTPPLPGSVELSPAPVIGGHPVTGTIMLARPAPTGGLTLSLTSDSPLATVPASITVPAGATMATFPVATTAVAIAKTVTVTVSQDGASWKATLQVLPPRAVSLALDRIAVIGSLTVIGTVTLSDPAPAGGAIVGLGADPKAAATVPATITVPAGKSSTTFLVSTLPVAANTDVVVRATSGGTTQTATLQVLPPVPTAFILSADQAAAGASVTGTVTLNGPAPAGGIAVTLSVQSAAIAGVSAAAVTLPASITIGAGAAQATFPVTVGPVTAATKVVLAATARGMTRTASLTVVPLALAAVRLDRGAVKGGEAVTGTVTLTGPAPAGGLIIGLSTRNPAPLALPQWVRVPAGATSASFPVKTSAVSGVTLAPIWASARGAVVTATLKLLPVGLTFSQSRVPGGQYSTGRIVLPAPAPAGGVTFTLSSNSPAVKMSAQVTVPAGATTAEFLLKAGPVSAPTPVIVTAAAGSTTWKATLTVAP